MFYDGIRVEQSLAAHPAFVKDDLLPLFIVNPISSSSLSPLPLLFPHLLIEQLHEIDLVGYRPVLLLVTSTLGTAQQSLLVLLLAPDDLACHIC